MRFHIGVRPYGSRLGPTAWTRAAGDPNDGGRRITRLPGIGVY
jgi:hypothetical protein